MVFRIYIDTSVIGGFYDIEFQEHSKRLFADFEAGRFVPVISDITIAEVRQAPEEVRFFLNCQALTNAEKVHFDEEAAILAESYITVVLTRSILLLPLYIVLMYWLAGIFNTL